MHVRPALGAIVLVVALALTGCAGSPAVGDAGAASAPADRPGDDGQSTGDACAIVQTSIDEATAAFSSASPSDPAAVVEALKAASAELVSVSEQVTNDEVAALLPPLRDMFAEASEAMAALSAGDVTRMADIARLSTSFQEAAGAYQELCAAG